MFLRQFGKYMPLNCDVNVVILNVVISDYAHPHMENLYYIFSCVFVPLALFAVTLVRSLVVGSVSSGTNYSM